MSTALQQMFHGHAGAGEGQFPGSGGNLNSVYAGAGEYEPEASDFGYPIGQFPAGELPSGSENQEFRISDSNAFNSLRGIAKTKFPFDPYPAQDHPNREPSSLADSFAQSDMAGVSSLLPGKYSYNNQQGSLSNQILQEFDAGTSTYNSLPWAEGPYALDASDRGARVNKTRMAQEGFNGQSQEGINPQSIAEIHKMSFASPADQDLPLTPFHKQYPNFGSGKVDYGFQEPGSDKMSEEIIRAFQAVLPEGQLAGTKKDLMPVFSSVNQIAIEQRPILQSLGKEKNTLYLGGTQVLPPELQIDPRQALLAGSNIPADIVQTAGELASALDTLGYYDADGLHTGNPYGQPMMQTRTIAGESAKMTPGFYSHLTTSSNEPLTFASSGSYEYTSSEPYMQMQ